MDDHIMIGSAPTTEERERAREAFFDQLEATAKRANLSSEEAETLVDAAIQAVRREGREAGPPRH